MKLFSVFVGMILILILYHFFTVWMVQSFPNGVTVPQEGNTGLLVFVTVVVPLLVFAGGLLTGFLIKPYLKKSFGEFLFHSPGLYYFIILVLVFIISAFFDSDPPAITIKTLGVCILGVFVGIVWSLSSCAGVAIGYKLRGRISNNKSCPLV